MPQTKVDIVKLRQFSRKLLREWGILKLLYQHKLPSSHAHALLEIDAGANSVSMLSERLILDISTVSRLISKLATNGMVVCEKSNNKQVKTITLSKEGLAQVKQLDEFSDKLIIDAFAYSSAEEQQKIFEGISLYASALEKSRLFVDNIEIRTLKKDKLLRSKVADMVFSIQNKELNVDVDPSVNDAILNAEKYFYFKGKCNFWYAVDKENKIAGCIGLKYLNEHSAELSKCFVAPEYRGRALSQKLITKLVLQAHKLDIEKIYLGTVDYFVWAHRFYEKIGFKRIKTESLPKEFVRCSVDGVFFCGETNKLIAGMLAKQGN